jgi:hypothetical protein
MLEPNKMKMSQILLVICTTVCVSSGAQSDEQNNAEIDDGHVVAGELLSALVRFVTQESIECPFPAMRLFIQIF